MEPSVSGRSWASAESTVTGTGQAVTSPAGEVTQGRVWLDGDHRRHRGRQMGEVVTGSETQDQQPPARVGQDRCAQLAVAATFPGRSDEPVDLGEDWVGVVALTAHEPSIGSVRPAEPGRRLA